MTYDVTIKFTAAELQDLRAWQERNARHGAHLLPQGLQAVLRADDLPAVFPEIRPGQLVRATWKDDGRIATLDTGEVVARVRKGGFDTVWLYFGHLGDDRDVRDAIWSDSYAFEDLGSIEVLAERAPGVRL